MGSLADRLYRPADDEPYMNPEQLDYFRQLLVRQRAELALQAKDSRNKMRTGTPKEADPLDQGMVAVERDFCCQEHLRQDRQLAAIEAALARIDEGSYGYCEETGEVIGLKRLLAQPAAALSVEAQDRMERLQRLARSKGMNTAH